MSDAIATIVPAAVPASPAVFNAGDQGGKSKRPRTVLGRRQVTIGDQDYVFELRSGGLLVRRWHGRKSVTITFPDLLATANGQKLLL